MALIQENNRQYYEGAQSFQTVIDQFEFTTTFDTKLKFLSDDPSNQSYNQNNFKIRKSGSGLPGSYEELNSTNNQFRVTGNTISFLGTGFTTDTSSSPPGAAQAVFTVPAGGIIPKIGMKFLASGSNVVWTPGQEGVRYAILNNVSYDATTNKYTVSWVQIQYGTLLYGGGSTLTTIKQCTILYLNP
jgi:hypothetical protein